MEAKKTDKLEKRKRFLWNAVYWAVVCVLLYVGFKYALGVVMPFCIGFIIALIVKPLVDLLHKKAHVPRGVASIFGMLLVYGIIGVLLALSVVQIVSLVQEVVARAPLVYAQSIGPAIANMFDGVQGLIQRFDPGRTLGLDQAAEILSTKLGQWITGFSGSVFTGTARIAASLPGLLVMAIFTVVSTFYFLKDYDAVGDFLLRQLPEHTGVVLVRGKKKLGQTLAKYVKSYGFIMGITFVELCAGLSILRVQNAGWWALLIAICDILPVLGVGTVLIPWGVISLIQGSVGRGAGLFVLYLVILVIRNIIEPRIVGAQVGLHPLLTLIAMYVGASLFGAFGLVGLPVALALIVALQKEGTINVYKE